MIFIKVHNISSSMCDATKCDQGISYHLQKLEEAIWAGLGAYYETWFNSSTVKGWLNLIMNLNRYYVG